MGKEITDLRITVSGPAGSGKSTMVLWLEKQLKKKDFDVQIQLLNELQDYGTETQFRYNVGYELKKKMKRIKADRKIILESIQTCRGSKKNNSKTKTDKNN
jgi:nucleoside-triphosphatase THEP1